MSTFIEKARRTLLEVAHEGPRSVADYSDSRLTGILDVYSAAQIVREIINNKAANGVWLTDHVPPRYLSGWPA